ncbi:hypothetical protein SAMN05216604_12455 [Pseudomonas agarici]|nr:hypothetical protein SAMN05216604_12455 [Pseudomonas agarici]
MRKIRTENSQPIPHCDGRCPLAALRLIGFFCSANERRRAWASKAGEAGDGKTAKNLQKRHPHEFYSFVQILAGAENQSFP